MRTWPEILGEEWYSLLKEEIEKEYFSDLLKFISNAYDTKIIYPKKGEVFLAYYLAQPSEIKVVIIGQDPYHTPKVAHGLAFSTKEMAIPPSLFNIFREIENDLGNGLLPYQSNDLTRWAEQGVFLLNTTLTVEKKKPLSHSDKGWEIFTMRTIELLSSKYNNIVYMLWGNNAKSFSSVINADKNLILEAAHPSPFSASRGFFGCKHFSKANEYLKSNNRREIEWVAPRDIFNDEF